MSSLPDIAYNKIMQWNSKIKHLGEVIQGNQKVFNTQKVNLHCHILVVKIDISLQKLGTSQNKKREWIF